MLDICLLGTGGMMPLPRRYLTSLLTRYNGSTLLIDCGEGTQMAIRESGFSFKPIDAICFTHYHGDHISGLPGILLAMANADRTEELVLAGPKGLERVVSGLRVIAPELPFPIKLMEITEPEQAMELSGFHITAFRVKHNMVCYGYTLEIPRGGKFDVERAKAANIPIPLWGRLQKGECVEHDGTVFTPEMVLGAPRRGLKVTYCTDSRPVPVIAEHAADADLFVCEGMYGEEEKEVKAREFKHMTMREAAKLGREASPRRMWLTHYSPSMVHPGSYLEELKKIFPPIELGKDGKQIELRFEDGDD